jgi:hypothetical protein
MVLRAQDNGDNADARRAAFAGMQRVSGEVTAVAGANVTVKSVDGSTVQIVTTTNTRMMKAGGVSFKVADLKLGDGVMAAGILDAPSKTLHAALLFATDAEQVKKLKENLGKTYIAGKVTAIDLDNAKMTVKRPDGAAQTIGFDETTSFKRGHARAGPGMFGSATAPSDAAGTPAPTGESITLADIKVGDNVGGQGSLKSGVFVPTQLTVATPRPDSAGKTAGAGPAGAATPQQ